MNEFKYLFLRICRYLLRFTGTEIILLIDNDSLSYACILFKGCDN